MKDPLVWSGVAVVLAELLFLLALWRHRKR